MIRTNYRIIQVDHSDSTAYWIEQTTYLFGWKFWIKTIGDYTIDSDYGDLDQMPFFSRTQCDERIKILKRQ